MHVKRTLALLVVVLVAAFGVMTGAQGTKPAAKAAAKKPAAKPANKK